MVNTCAQHLSLISIITGTLTFFGIAGIIIPLLERIKISPMLGYIICGAAIGPFGIAQLSEYYPWTSSISISNTETVYTLGELGIISLMFMIGLELSLDRLKAFKKLIFGLGSMQIYITALSIFLIATQFFNYTYQAAILIGASFALSSTAVVMRLLEEENLSSRPVGILCFSILLMQDLAVVPILILASSFTGGAETNIIITLLTSLVASSIAVICIYWVGNKLITPLLHSVCYATGAEWLTAFTVFIVFAFSALTYSAGLSLALGGFIAGLLIAETEFSHEIDIIVTPLKGVLLGVFFLSIGMMIDFTLIIQRPFALTFFLLGLFILKSTIIFFASLLFKIPKQEAAQAAFYLAQPGEFALMILGVAISAKLLSTNTVQFYLIATVIGMIFTPLLFNIGNKVKVYLMPAQNKNESDQILTDTTGEGIVLIAGLGRFGGLITNVLEKGHIPYLGFDTNIERVQQLKKENIHIIYGDARKKELWNHLMKNNVQAVVITIDSYEATKQVLISLRKQFPLLTIIVRSNNTHNSKSLYENGATAVISETLESSLRIAEILMEKLERDPQEIQRTLEATRLECELGNSNTC